MFNKNIILQKHPLKILKRLLENSKNRKNACKVLNNRANKKRLKRLKKKTNLKKKMITTNL